MAGKKRGLGRGLDALLGGDPAKTEARDATSAPQRDSLAEIPVEFIQPGRYQPRREMDQGALEELAASITAQGLMQPVVLRAIGEDKYELIAGERRWRACQLAGLDRVPALVKEVPDEAVVAMSLIENIQREDLNPMEEALALARLLDEFDLTHQQVADAVGKSRTAVTNTLRLNQLSRPVAEMLARGDLEMGHARALLTLPEDIQRQAARQIVDKHLNVRQAEALVRNLVKGKPEPSAPRLDNDTRRLQERLMSKLGQPVHIKHTKRGKGQLVIDYNNLDELDGILARFGDLD